MSEAHVKVGGEPIHAYVGAVRTAFEDDADMVVLSMRGTNLKKGVDTAEILKNEYDTTISFIESETQCFEPDESEEDVCVSALHFYLEPA